MQRFYPAIFEPDVDDGGYVVVFPDLPGCVTQGDSWEEAFEMAMDAAMGWCLAQQDAKRVLPHPTPAGEVKPPKGAIAQLVPVPVLMRKERVNLTLDDALLREIDRRGLKRSGFVNAAAWQALMERTDTRD